VHVQHDADFAWNDCSASVQAKSSKMASVFSKEKKICYKMVYYTSNN